MPYTTATTEDKPDVLFATQMLVSSVIKSAMCKGFAGMTGTPVLGDAHAHHLNKPDLHLAKVDGALDPNCKSRRSGTKLPRDGSSKSAGHSKSRKCRTSEKTNHKVNEKKTESLKVQVHTEEILKIRYGKPLEKYAPLKD